MYRRVPPRRISPDEALDARLLTRIDFVRLSLLRHDSAPFDPRPQPVFEGLADHAAAGCDKGGGYGARGAFFGEDVQGDEAGEGRAADEFAVEASAQFGAGDCLR